MAASKGMDVLLVMDSITGLAIAQREVGLSAGEPPTMKGYTPFAFYLLSKRGSITGIFSVLVEMSVLDGHIILSRKRAIAGLYPSVDPVRSLSRAMPQVVRQDHMKMS